MEKTTRKAASFEEMKQEEYRYWQSVPASERIRAGDEMSVEGYRAYGYSGDGRELKRTLVRFQRGTTLSMLSRAGMRCSCMRSRG